MMNWNSNDDDNKSNVMIIKIVYLGDMAGDVGMGDIASCHQAKRKIGGEKQKKRYREIRNSPQRRCVLIAQHYISLTHV
jgi:hypothetical protein